MRNAERNLALETQAAAILREMLATVTDEDGIADSIASETNLQEAIAEVLDNITEDEALTAGLKAKCEEMVARRLRLEHRIERRRAAIERAMSVAELHRLELPTATLSLRRVPPGLEIVDEGQIPREYFVPQPDKLDRTKLKAALKEKDVFPDGADIPGARLDNGGISLSVRRA